MARPLLERRYWQRIKEYQNRLQPGVASSYRIGGHPGFIDYWTDIPATIPEKMVFAELVRRQINFKFSWFLGDVPGTEKRERYRPDFILMDYRVIIEVFGLYWHTRPGMAEYDTVRAMKLTTMGYKVYAVTDYDLIGLGAAAVMDRIPEVASAAIQGNTHMIGKRPFDPTASIRARMRKWPRVSAVRYRMTRMGVIPPVSSYDAPGAPIPAEDRELGPLADIEGLTLQDWYDPPKRRRRRRLPRWPDPYQPPAPVQPVYPPGVPTPR